MLSLVKDSIYMAAFFFWQKHRYLSIIASQEEISVTTSVSLKYNQPIFFQSYGVEEVREKYLFIYLAKHDVSEL